MKVFIIAAVAKNGVIGRAGKLPWHLPEDLKRFKQLTTGHAVVMGRKTWESIGKPLPGRRNIVLTRHADYPLPSGVARYASLDAAVAACRAAGEKTVFVIGGAQVYSEAFPYADGMYLTQIEQDAEGDVQFPTWNPREWLEVSRKKEKGMTFVEYGRRRKS